MSILATKRTWDQKINAAIQQQNKITLVSSWGILHIYCFIYSDPQILNFATVMLHYFDPTCTAEQGRRKRVLSKGNKALTLTFWLTIEGGLISKAVSAERYFPVSPRETTRLVRQAQARAVSV